VNARGRGAYASDYAEVPPRVAAARRRYKHHLATRGIARDPRHRSRPAASLATRRISNFTGRSITTEEAAASSGSLLRQLPAGSMLAVDDCIADMSDR
jgi:hypothetical protein